MPRPALADLPAPRQLLRPEFSSFVPRERQHEIFDLITRLIEKLGSPEVAIDERHTPALHSRFLHGLLRKHRRELAVSARLPDHQQPPSQHEAQTANRSAPGGATFPAQGSSSASQQPSSSSAAGQGGPGGYSFGTAAAGGASYESVAGSSPASFSDSSFSGMAVSPVFEEPAYTTGGGGGGSGGMNGHGAVNLNGAGMFQFGQGQDENWGALLALQNPSYWKDMMMPGCVLFSLNPFAYADGCCADFRGPSPRLCRTR